MNNKVTDKFDGKEIDIERWILDTQLYSEHRYNGPIQEDVRGMIHQALKKHE